MQSLLLQGQRFKKGILPWAWVVTKVDVGGCCFFLYVSNLRKYSLCHIFLPKLPEST